MRSSFCVLLFLLTVSAGQLQGQARPAHQDLASVVEVWRARPVPRELALQPGPLSRALSSDSTRRRPFYLPRPGEQTAYWAGFGAGLALSPFLWCNGCGAVSKAATSLGMACAGAVSGLLLSRTF